MRSLIWVVGILWLCSSIAVAQASPREDDTITLRDGTILRGRVTEQRPGDYLVIVLFDGRSERVEWANLAQSAGPSFPVAPPGERFRGPAPGRVPIEIESNGDRLTVGVLHAEPVIGSTSVTVDDGASESLLTINYQALGLGAVVCSTTPCRIFARPGQLTLQASGLGLLSYAAALEVPPSGGRLVLRAPSASQRRIGSTLIATSVGAIVAGALAMGLGAAFGPHDASVPTRLMPGVMPTDDRPIYYGVGGVVMGAGVLMTTVGAILYATNRTGIASFSCFADGIHF